MKVEEPDLSGSYTYADYLTWSWNEMTELIRGKIYKMSPAPGSIHQRISIELCRQIANYLHKKKCQVFSAPFDVRLPGLSNKKGNQDIITVVQPDICIVCDPTKIDRLGCLGAPDWVIEILSQHTSQKDLREKFEVYEEAGVKEYWVIHPQEQTVLVYLLEQGKFRGILKPYIRTDRISPVTLPELIVILEDVFPDEDYVLL